MTFKRTVDSNGDIITSKETQSFSFLSSRMDVFGFALTKIQFFILLTFVSFTLGRNGCKNMNLYISSFFFCVCVYLCISVYIICPHLFVSLCTYMLCLHLMLICHRILFCFLFLFFFLFIGIGCTFYHSIILFFGVGDWVIG